MSTYRLQAILAPASIAITGAGDSAVGAAIGRHLEDGGFAGALHRIAGAGQDLAHLPGPADLVVIAGADQDALASVTAAAQRGCSGALLVGDGPRDPSLRAQIAAVARQHGLRLIGPSCFGLLSPRAKLNASLAAGLPVPGDLALISQSSSLAAGVIAWAGRRKIGFSAAICLGDMIDVDFADCLDHFAADRQTRAILIAMESITDAAKFMSAARAAARIKPVVVLKSGARSAGEPRLTHAAALVLEDQVYQAAFRRAGLLSVRDLDELFAAAETLGRIRPSAGERLAVIGNGAGLGALAADRLHDLNGELAALSPATSVALSPLAIANPLDLGIAATPETYRRGVLALLADAGVDAVLAMNAPTGLSGSSACAEAVVAAVKDHAQAGSSTVKPVLAAWIGADDASRDVFEAARIPSFETESDAVRGFRHLVDYAQAQQALMETPSSLPEGFSPKVSSARAIVTHALEQGRRWLDPIEVTGLLEAYGIPVVRPILAGSAEEAVAAARSLIATGQAVALKIVSPDIVHKSEIGGVALDLASEAAVAKAAAGILARARQAMPHAAISGLIVQPMRRKPKARELIMGIGDDPVFGPVILFGRGGIAVELIEDTALALPPLDLRLAHDLVARTRVSRVLAAYRDVAAADLDAIAATLVRLSQMAADLPELRELDLNPVLADAGGVEVVDARILLAPVEARRVSVGHPRFAVRPYPKEWERRFVLKNAMTFFVRPIRPEDEDLVARMLARVSPEDLRLRFFAPVKQFSHLFLARLTQLDYARAVAFIALDEATGEPAGVVRLHADANHDHGEYAILLRTDLKGLGLGWALMALMIEWAQADGLTLVEGQVLHDNTSMLAMCRKLGFAITVDPDDSDLRLVRLSVADAARLAQAGRLDVAKQNSTNRDAASRKPAKKNARPDRK